MIGDIDGFGSFCLEGSRNAAWNMLRVPPVEGPSYVDVKKCQRLHTSQLLRFCFTFRRHSQIGKGVTW